jgi:imidazolonepropionase-like amidohydrolase
MKALVGANLIDGTGGPVVNDATVLIDGERIVETGPREAVILPPNTEIVDLAGMTLLPGMIDCHDHLASKDYGLPSRLGYHEPLSLQHLRTAKVLEDTLAAGYTCVRDGGGLDAGFKQAIEQGLYPGPRLVLSVAIISPTGGLADKVTPSGQCYPHDDPMIPSGVADGDDPVRAKVREMARVGADVIKFATTGGASSRPGHGPLDIAFGPSEVRALIDEAQALGRRTMCHAVGGPGLRMCVEAGAHSIEHGCYLAEDPDLLKMMADQGIFLVPTFEIYEFHATLSAPHMQARSRALMDIHRETLHQALAAGVKVVAGTDAGGYVHGDNAREVQIMVERGMPNMQAIQACTGWAAECVGLDQDIGTVTRGKYADLLVIDGDPLHNIEALRQPDSIKLVMKGGETVVDKLPVREPVAITN